MWTLLSKLSFWWFVFLVGQNGTNFRYRHGKLFEGSPGNSTLRDGFSNTFCPSFFTDEVAGVVCFNYGFLP